MSGPQSTSHSSDPSFVSLFTERPTTKNIRSHAALCVRGTPRMFSHTSCALDRIASILRSGRMLEIWCSVSSISKRCMVWARDRALRRCPGLPPRAFALQPPRRLVRVVLQAQPALRLQVRSPLVRQFRRSVPKLKRQRNIIWSVIKSVIILQHSLNATSLSYT